MAVVLSQDTLDERVKQEKGRCFGRYQRALLVALMALAFFGASSAVDPKEALAHVGYHTHQLSDGRYYSCWEDWNGSEYYVDGCVYYYGGQHPAHYEQYWSGRTFVWSNSQWIPIEQYWVSTPATFIVSSSQNQTGYDFFAAQSNAAMSATILSNWRSSMDSRASTGSQDAAAPQAPPPADASRTSESSTDSKSSRMAFPWKVCQDESGCFRYGGTAWKKVRASQAQGDTYRVSSSKTRGAFFAAQGATDAGGGTMKLITKTGPKMGKAKVLVTNLASGKVVKQVTFDLKTDKNHYKVAKSIKGLTPHKPYGLIVLSADGRPVAVDAVGYYAHGNMCHNVI